MKTLILSIAFSFLSVILPRESNEKAEAHNDLPKLVKVKMVGDKMMPYVELPEMEVFSDNQPGLATYNAGTGNYVLESALPGVFVTASREQNGRVYKAENVNGSWMPNIDLPTMEIIAYKDNFYAESKAKELVSGG